MKASVIIPAKKAKKTIPSCLEALFKQDQSLIEEIIIVENGSRELSELPIVQKVKLVHLHNSSRSEARNHGAKLATGDFLVFLDADVLVGKKWITEVMEAYKKGANLIMGPVVPISEEFNLLQKTRLYRALTKSHGTFLIQYQDQKENFVINSAAFAIDKTSFMGLNGFDIHLKRHEDLDFTQRILRTQAHITVLKNVRCDVLYSGSFLSYLHREFSQGLDKVRFHEKWDAHSWKGSLVIFPNFAAWVKSLKFLRSNSLMVNVSILLNLLSLLGNFVGIIKKIFLPYPGSKMKITDYKAKVEYQ